MLDDPLPIVSVGPPAIWFAKVKAPPTCPRVPLMAKSRVLEPETSVFLPRISGAEIRLTDPATPPLMTEALAVALLSTRADVPVMSVVTAPDEPPNQIAPTVVVPVAATPSARSSDRLLARAPCRIAMSAVVEGVPVFGSQFAALFQACVPPPRTFQV